MRRDTPHREKCGLLADLFQVFQFAIMLDGKKEGNIEEE